MLGFFLRFLESRWISQIWALTGASASAKGRREDAYGAEDPIPQFRQPGLKSDTDGRLVLPHPLRLDCCGETQANKWQTGVQGCEKHVTFRLRLSHHLVKVDMAQITVAKWMKKLPRAATNAFIVTIRQRAGQGTKG